MNLISILYFFVMASFIGYYVVWSVTPDAKSTRAWFAVVTATIAFTTAPAAAESPIPVAQPAQSFSAFSTKSLYKMLKDAPPQAFNCTPSAEGGAQYRRLVREIERRTDSAPASRKRGGTFGEFFDRVSDQTGIDGHSTERTQKDRQDCTPEYEARALSRQANLLPILAEYERRR